MTNIVKLPSAATTPRDLLSNLSAEAERMDVLVAVIRLEDGTWHVRWSTAQSSTIQAASVRLLKAAMEA